MNRSIDMMKSGLQGGRTSAAIILVGLASTMACADLTKTAFPAGVSDPNTYHTQTAALQLYAGAVYSFTGGAGVSAGSSGGAPPFSDSQGAFVHFVLASGLFTDELQAGNLGGAPADYAPGTGQPITATDSIDARLFWQSAGDKTPYDTYTFLQTVRGAAAQAIGSLATYAPTTSPALRGHLYALEAYAELALADLYCSGVPLSTVDFNADYTYSPGFTTVQVYQHALALFDTAITLSTDSARILNLARVGEGRTLLALGRYADAAQAVTNVPTTYQYTFSLNWGVENPGELILCTIFRCSQDNVGRVEVTVSDFEGDNGLPYLTSNDPRSASEQFGVNHFSVPQYAPMKYGATAPAVAPLVIASGIEARLIEAEAALQAGSPEWLTILNTLRTDGSIVSIYTRTCQPGITGTQVGSPCPAGVQDTTWGAGTGVTVIPTAVRADGGPVCPTSVAPGTACTDTVWYKGLKPLTDPGNNTARVNLLFQERAYWLFLTGERQGDLRRLVRNYGRDPETVYPSGAYPIGQQLPFYGHAVSENIPATEFRNPKFTGCLSQGA